MADNVTVSNSPTSINTDIPVRTIEKSGEQVQVMAIDYGGGGTEDLTVPDFATEGTLLNINSALSSGLNATINSDVLGVAVTGQRNNEVELSFFTSFNTDLITNTTASGGSATITNGHARYKTGSNTTGAAKGVSVYSCKYRPAHEQYAFFTAAFTAGVTDSYQRIGLYDTSNGFFIGYEGTSFGVTLRTGSADTTIAQASWNGDPLDGSSGSKFTRGGTPEAINLAYSNLYRIRFAWLGSASVLFEVFSPDGGWIGFHTIRIPNSQLNPSIRNPELPMTVDVAKTSGASDLSIYTACWAAGTTSDVTPLNETLNEYSLAKLTRSVITGETTAGGGGFVNVKVNPSGALTISLGDISDVVGQETMANSVPVVIASDQAAIPVTGTLSISTTGLATDTNQATEISYLTSIDSHLIKADTDNVSITTALPAGTNNIGDVDVLTLPNVTLASQANPFTQPIPVSDNGGSITVDGTVAATQSGTWNVNNISGTVSLPTGAATSAKQAALGTAGTASSDVITVQGIASMTALKVDGSSVTQPISGTVTANAGSGTFAISASSLPLPTGAATETTLSSLNGKVTACNTGAVTISAALPAGNNNIGDVDVVTLPNITLASQVNPFTSAIPIADNGGSITVDGTVAATQSGSWSVSASQSGTWNITNISGTISLPTGAATESTLSTLNGKVTACNTGAVTISAALPAGTNNIGDVDVLTLPSVTLASQANPFSSAVPVSDNGGSITVDGTVAATQSGAWSVADATYSTSSITSVTAAATSTSLLASTSSRRQAIFYNDCDKGVYVKLGTTASATSFSYRLLPGQTLELPNPVYTGAIQAIWDSSPTGAMRITEIT